MKSNECARNVFKYVYICIRSHKHRQVAYQIPTKKHSLSPECSQGWIAEKVAAALVCSALT